MGKRTINFSIIQIEGLPLAVESIISMTVDDGDNGTEAVHTLTNSPRATGYRSGVQEVSGSFEALRFDPPEVDWWTWKNFALEKLVQYEEKVRKGDLTAGKRWHLEDLRITSISKSREVNAATDSIEWIALYHGPQVL